MTDLPSDRLGLPLPLPLLLTSLLSLSAPGCADDDNDVAPSGESGAASGTDAVDSTDGHVDNDDGSPGTTHGEDTADSTADDDDSTGAPNDPLMGDTLLARLPGLWAAPVTSETSVGDFPIMNMDIRAADDHTLFSRVDLDTDNNLRFAFTYETHPEHGRVLVYRNGGLFQGILRDTRTRLTEFDADTDTWHFCAIEGGCGYIDAQLQVTETGTLDLDVAVLGMHHIHWAPSRVQDGALPESFGENTGEPADPFPPLPTLSTTLSWTNASDEGEEAWLILFNEPCAIMAGPCDPARFIRVVTEAGQTEVILDMAQIHPGSYHALAVLDRNANLGATLLPDGGDVVSVPNVRITVDAEGDSTAMIPVSFEL